MENTAENSPRRRGRPPKTVLKKPVEASKPSVEPKIAVEAEADPVQEPVRPQMRPILRNEDPRAAAARRAAEIRGHLGDMDDGTDRFTAPRPPDGWTYEWKRRSVLGAEDHDHINKLEREGWSYVPVDMDEEHRSMMPRNWKGNNIERDGMVLMMRPSVITEEVRQIKYRRAKGQVMSKEQQLNAAPDGHFERSNKDKSLATVKKAFEPINVPD